MIQIEQQSEGQRGTMDWVEERARRDERLRSGVPRYWDYLKAAFEHAVMSYNAHYKGQFIAGFEAQYPETVHVMRDLRNFLGNMSTRTDVAITFEQSKKQVTMRYSDGLPLTLAFSLDADNRVVLMNGHLPMDEEAASKFILERLLFPLTQP
jgi:hypothetical protein